MKGLILSSIAALILIGGAAFMTSKQSTSTSAAPADNVSIVDEKQIVTIEVKGGYSPRVSTAKAGIPTVIRFKTNNTFDCSSAILIPSMNISRILPQTGLTDIDIGMNKEGSLNGSCGMGMYRFEIDFQS